MNPIHFKHNLIKCTGIDENRHPHKHNMKELGSQVMSPVLCTTQNQGVLMVPQIIVNYAVFICFPG